MPDQVTMRIYRGITVTLLVLLLVAIVLLAPGFYIFTHKSMPQVRGELVLEGLAQPALVIRDKWGVPHIYAKTRHDLFFASGFVQAQDRLFQMDLLRRVCQGRLSEWVGRGALGSDRLARVVGFHRQARENLERIPPESRSVVEAFTRGVNAYAERRKVNLPIEYSALPGGFDPWKPEDTLSIALYIGWGLTSDWHTELLRLGLSEERGKEKAFEIMPPYSSKGPYIIPPAEWPGTTLGSMRDRDIGKEKAERAALGPERLAELFRADECLRGFISSTASASNSWVVDGAMSRSGKPILANDPHLELTLPSIWYELHLAGAGLDVSGVTFPGIPLVVLGHTKHIAWAATTTQADMDDLFIERVDPENPDHYMTRGEWRPFQVIQEKIKLRSGEGHSYEPIKVRVGAHGPVINDVLDPPLHTDRALALCWTGYEFTDQVGALLQVARSKDWESFREGIHKLGCPIQNWLYADMDGNIGYIAAGLFPVRPSHEGTFPAPGQGGYDWEGFASLEEVPQVKNPKSHYIAAANNRVMPNHLAPYVISWNYDPPYRAMRVMAMLEEARGEKLTGADMTRMQMDVVSMRARRLLPVFLETLEKKRSQDPELDRVWRQLEGWDCRMEAAGAAPAIFAEAYWQAFRLTYEDEMSEELFHRLKSIQPAENAFDNILEIGGSVLFDDRRTDEVETREDVVHRALKEAVRALSELKGERMSTWEWGDLHRLHLTHPLGEAEELRTVANLFRINRPPLSLAGGRNTVNKGAYPLGGDYKIKVGPSMRHVVDFGDLDNATLCFPGGQSGQPFSSHYADQVELWKNGNPHPMPMSMQALQEAEESRLQLVPAGHLGG